MDRRLAQNINAYEIIFVVELRHAHLQNFYFLFFGWKRVEEFVENPNATYFRKQCGQIIPTYVYFS